MTLGILWTPSTALKVRVLLVVSAQQGGCSPVMAIDDDDDDDHVPKKEGGTACLFLLPFLVVTTNYVVPNVIAGSPTSPPQRIPSTDTVSTPREYLVFFFCTPPTSLTETISSVRLTAAQSILRTRADSRLCAKFITHLFACTEIPPSSSGSTVKLLYSIAYALHHAKLHPCDICITCPSPATEGPFSNRTGLIGSSIICLGLHAGEQGDLRQHLLTRTNHDRSSPRVCSS